MFQNIEIYQCAGCQREVDSTISHNTELGNLCPQCYNVYLDFAVVETKKAIPKSFFLHLVPNISTIIIASLYYFEILHDEDISAFSAILVILAGVGAYFLAKNGFNPVGEAGLHEYYKANINDNNVRISKRTYSMYSTDQWITIVSNLIKFTASLLLILTFGSLIFFYNIWAHSKATRNYERYFNPTIQNDASDNESDTVNKMLSGSLAKKVLNLQQRNLSLVSGVMMEHIGYIIHSDELYGAIQTDVPNDMFATKTLYFIKVLMDGESYELVSVDTSLYNVLYQKFIDLPDAN